MDWPTFVRRVEKSRKFGEVYGREHYWKNGPDLEEAKKAVRGLGFAVVGELPNISLPPESARQLIVDMLTRSMTYETLLPNASKAEALADEYMAFH